MKILATSSYCHTCSSLTLMCRTHPCGKVASTVIIFCLSSGTITCSTQTAWLSLRAENNVQTSVNFRSIKGKGRSNEYMRGHFDLALLPQLASEVLRASQLCSEVLCASQLCSVNLVLIAGNYECAGSNQPI